MSYINNMYGMQKNGAEQYYLQGSNRDADVENGHVDRWWWG